MSKLRTYTTMDVVKLFQRVDSLTRENTALREQVRQLQEANALLQRENEDYLVRLADFENYYARQRSAGRTILAP